MNDNTCSTQHDGWTRHICHDPTAIRYTRDSRQPWRRRPRHALAPRRRPRPRRAHTRTARHTATPALPAAHQEKPPTANDRCEPKSKSPGAEPPHLLCSIPLRNGLTHLASLSAALRPPRILLRLPRSPPSHTTRCLILLSALLALVSPLPPCVHSHTDSPSHAQHLPPPSSLLDGCTRPRPAPQPNLPVQLGRVVPHELRRPGKLWGDPL